MEIHYLCHNSDSIKPSKLFGLFYRDRGYVECKDFRPSPCRENGLDAITTTTNQHLLTIQAIDLGYFDFSSDLSNLYPRIEFVIEGSLSFDSLCHVKGRSSTNLPITWIRRENSQILS